MMTRPSKKCLQLRDRGLDCCQVCERRERLSEPPPHNTMSCHYPARACAWRVSQTRPASSAAMRRVARAEGAAARRDLEALASAAGLP